MDEYFSMKEIGALYGVSSHVIGKLFKTEELRTQEGRPSKRAFQDGYVVPRQSEDSEWARA